MSDPRNAAHDKKVQQEKKHDKQDKAEPAASSAVTPEPAVADAKPGELEGSTVVLSKLKDMAFHSRANLETLAGLTLTIEDELKQKEFSAPIGELYSAQEAFQAKIATLIESYEEKCSGLKPAA